MTLDSYSEWNSNIQPILLASGNQSYVNNTMTVTGWGRLDHKDWRRPAELRKTEVKVWANRDCERSYHGREDITDDMLCASGDNTDSCQVSLFLTTNTFKQL